MIFDELALRDSPLKRIDPRARLASALAFAVIVACIGRVDMLLVALAVAVLLVMAARIPVAILARRLGVLMLFMAIIWITLPLTTPGTTVTSLGPLVVSEEGLLAAARITLKGASILLAVTGLASTMTSVQFGHALGSLGVPSKLVQLFVLSARYIDVMAGEQRRLTRALRARAFEPRFSLHTLRTLGYVVGLLLVNSVSRSERILAAMKCRGYDGRIHLLEERRFSRRDAGFVAAALLLCLGLAWGEWL
jgi:cobalt/nickel transport system permease protein